MTTAQEPFFFRASLTLTVMTGLKAKNLSELFEHIRAVPESSIYHHTHRFLHQHQFLVPEPPNDFAYWVTNVLQEERLGEQLAAIDTIRFTTLTDLRHALVSVIERYLKKTPELRQAPEGDEFHFMRSVLFVLPTPYQARDLSEFTDCLKKVSIHSLYYHIFEARLRTPGGLNDFSRWLKNSLREEALAKAIAKLDPYTSTLEGIRSRVLHLVNKRTGELTGGSQ